MKRLSLFYLLFCIVPVFAQPTGTLKVEMSAPFENDRKRTYVTDMFHDSSGNIYLVKSEDKTTIGEVLAGPLAKNDPTVLLEKYDAALNQVYSTPLFSEAMGDKKVYYQGVYVLNKKPWFFSAYFDSEQDMRYLYRHELKENGKLGDPLRVAEMESRKGGGRFNIIFSPDSLLLAVVARPAVKGKKPEELTFRVFDREFHLVREGSTTFPYINKEMDVNGLTLTNQGDFSALVSWEKDKNRDGKQFAQEIFVFPNGENEPRRIPLDLGENYALHFFVLPDKNGNLYGVGPYNLISKRQKFKDGVPPTSLGTAWIRIDHATWEPGKPVLNLYKTETKTFMESKSKLVYGYGFQYFRNYKAWVTDDGRVFLDMEQDWGTVTQGNALHSTHNQSEMILLLQFDPSGKVTQEVIVPHKVSGGGIVQGLFHIALHKGDTFYFIYNDNAKNFRKEFKKVKDIEAVVAPGSSGIPLKSNKPHVVLCTVGPDGTKTFDSVFDFKAVEVFLHTPNVLITDNSTLVVVGSYGRDFRLFRLKL
jgi:hypothetical protein